MFENVRFGNISKMVPLVIMTVTVCAATLIALLNGYDYKAFLDAGLVLVTGAGAAGVGSVTAAVAKSQTRIELEAAQAFAVVDEPVPVPSAPVSYDAPVE